METDEKQIEFSEKELCEALRAINSLLHKCQKSLEKVTANTSQHTLLINRINALKVASALIDKELQKSKTAKN